MGKKNNSNSLGRSLIKDRFSNKSERKFIDSSMLHTTELQDGYDWGRLNLQSVTEESSFQEFLSTAELAGTEFQAEKLNIKFVNPKSNVGLLTKEEKLKYSEEFKKNKEVVKIPRRPAWHAGTTAEELHQKERDSFLEWRRSLAVLQEEKGLLLTPYEKNIEFWRQLWRVIERSDVVIQIVDARNPLLFKCEDLEKYVKEVSEDKINLILLNKADYLTEEQRRYWVQYFNRTGTHIAFFSALLAGQSKLEDNSDDNIDKTYLRDVKEKVKELELSVERTAESLSKVIKATNELIDTKIPDIKAAQSIQQISIETDNKSINNSSNILTREELIAYLKTIHLGKKITRGVTTVGLVGYPNVGKSSTINTLMTVKKVSVSATPGKTKHFQTLYLDEELLLCDCPGLVMPSFVYTKAEMIINGILPVDQMRDHVPPINLISNLIPRYVLEDTYGIILPKPLEGEDEDRCPTAEEILNAYGYNRGFMTANGQPDNPRAARYILKDFINGKLLYAHPPPDVKDEEFNKVFQKKNLTNNRLVTPGENRATRVHRMTTQELDRNFFNSGAQGAHIKSGKAPLSTGQSDGEKPWKKNKKHANKNKKEKLRRVYAHLDQH